MRSVCTNLCFLFYMRYMLHTNLQFTMISDSAQKVSNNYSFIHQRLQDCPYKYIFYLYQYFITHNDKALCSVFCTIHFIKSRPLFFHPTAVRQRERGLSVLPSVNIMRKNASSQPKPSRLMFLGPSRWTREAVCHHGIKRKTKKI